ncbi:hypothetical protein AMJ80_07180 [bacterium SM23_31]|nr:MAG: hypothetical protein AMJ80_07180 [bacterium SM23_31]
MSKSHQKDSGGDNGFSRRSFLKGVGTGVISTAVLPGVVSAGKYAEKIQSPQEWVTSDAITLNVNGENRRVTVESRATLVSVLRNELNLTGTKNGCGTGECGACTVLIDGEPAYSCLTLAMDAVGRKIVTIEGLAENGQLSPVQQAFLEYDGYQCGYCTPGQIMAAEGLLAKNPNPSTEEIKRGMSGNLCRCAAYQHIFISVAEAAKKGGR